MNDEPLYRTSPATLGLLITTRRLQAYEPQVRMLEASKLTLGATQISPNLSETVIFARSHITNYLNLDSS